jgi:hypothetical protein
VGSLGEELRPSGGGVLQSVHKGICGVPGPLQNRKGPALCGDENPLKHCRHQKGDFGGLQMSQ